MKLDLRKTAAVLIASCVLTAGCLLKETTHTLYLDPDGAVTWSILEREVRSDNSAGHERAQEEGRYLQAVRSDEGALAEALRRLGGRRVRSTVLREDRPFAALTEARFPSARRMVTGLLEGFGLEGDVELLQAGDRMQFSLVFDTDQDSDISEDDPLVALIEDAERYRIVLTEGTFAEADGFVLDDSKTIATLALDEKSGGRIALSLSWIVER